MRGLVVVGILALSLFLLFSHWTSAESTPTTDQPFHVSISCMSNSGTVVQFQSNKDVQNLKVADICDKTDVPANWTVQCYTSRQKDAVSVQFEIDGHLKETTVPCT